MWRGDWRPWSTEGEWPSSIHSVAWPAALSGVVWLKVQPLAEHVDADHHLQLEWGPWIRRVETHISENGVLIFTGKAADADGISRTLNLTCNKRVFLLYGAGDGFDDEDRVIDIRRGWTLAEDEPA